MIELYMNEQMNKYIIHDAMNGFKQINKQIINFTLQSSNLFSSVLIRLLIIIQKTDRDKMDKELYLTQAQYNNNNNETPDTSMIPTKDRNIPVKALNNPNDRRNQVSKKILSDFPLQGYYDDKKIKPGITLYKVIVQTQDKRRQGQYKGPHLHLNMHPTIVFTDNVNTMIYYQQGIIQTMNYISYQQYIAKSNISQEQIRNNQHIVPLIMTKSSNGIMFQNTIVMNNQITAKIVPRSENVISTKFILPYGLYPNIIRLFYIPRTIKNIKKNYAYKVINRKQMNEESYKKKHRMINQFMIHIDNEDSYIATLMKGRALEPFEAMAQSLCEYVQNALMVVISEIVLDFIVDQNKDIYFNQIKAVKSKNKTKLWEIGTQEQIIKLASQNNSQIMCRLCGMLYCKQEMAKLVTNKLIYELAAHLQNRGKKLQNIPHMKKEGLSNVCHLCYQLIKAEHTLINVQREFGKLMNIRQGTVERVQSKQTKQAQLFFYDQEQFQKLGKQTSKFKKWRLFFYLQNLKRIPQIQLNQAENVQVMLEMKFQNLKEKFVKKLKNPNYDPTLIEANISKNWAKSMRTTHNNFLKHDSIASSKKSTIRVQSAHPLRAALKSEQQQVNDNQYQTLVNQQPSMLQGNIVKDKSYFNDQTTCITHSQSYFSTINNNNNNDRSRVQNPNNTTLAHVLSNHNISNQLNQLDSLYEDPHEESFIHTANVSKQHNFKKKLHTINQTDILNNSSVPQTVKLDKVKMFIFYTKTHQNQGKNILAEEEIQFTLTFTPLGISSGLGSRSSQQIKFTGNSSTLTCLKNKQTCQRHSLQIYLFDQGMKYCNLQLTVGMICDGEYDDEGLDLQKCKNLYWGKTYSCDPLPDEWMEVFTHGEQVPKGNVEKVLQTLQQNNFSTEPIELEQNPPSVDYLKEFEKFAQSTINPMSTITGMDTRPMSALQNSQSATGLKKTSMIRCRTAALNRNTMSHTNLLTSQQQTRSPQGMTASSQLQRKNSSSKKMLHMPNEQEGEEYLDLEM